MKNKNFKVGDLVQYQNLHNKRKHIGIILNNDNDSYIKIFWFSVLMCTFLPGRLLQYI